VTTRVNTVGCTIVAKNYTSYVRVLADGWRRHHEDVPFHVLVIDADAGGAPSDEFEVVSPSELGLSAAELAQMRGIYDVAELTTALKPHLLRFLLDAGNDAVIYLDSDHDVHAGLHDVAPLAARHGIALSTHLLEPPPLDGRSPSESEIGWSGIFNSGFIAVGQSGRAFLEWWASRLRRDCIFCEPMGVHADQRWLDFVPSYFEEYCVLRDAGINVAAWNVHERQIRDENGSLTVNGGPLRTFHFSGYDPHNPRLPGPGGWPAPLRFEIAAEPALERLCRAYGEKLFAAGYHDFRRSPYPYATTAAGSPLRTWRRRTYRELLIAAEMHDRDIPDPFDGARSAEFEHMLADPATTGLLSDGALARITDARIVEPIERGDPWAPLRIASGLARQFARRLPVRRHPWMPHPLPSDRTRLEYGAAARPHAPAA
jgi:hypothetical protein